MANLDEQLANIPREFTKSDLIQSRNIEREYVNTVESGIENVQQRIESAKKNNDPFPHKEFDSITKGIEQLRKTGLGCMIRKPVANSDIIDIGPAAPTEEELNDLSLKYNGESLDDYDINDPNK